MSAAERLRHTRQLAATAVKRVALSATLHLSEGPARAAVATPTFAQTTKFADVTRSTLLNCRPYRTDF
jgi:hypothetical protein